MDANAELKTQLTVLLPVTTPIHQRAAAAALPLLEAIFEDGLTISRSGLGGAMWHGQWRQPRTGAIDVDSHVLVIAVRAHEPNEIVLRQLVSAIERIVYDAYYQAPPPYRTSPPAAPELWSTYQKWVLVLATTVLASVNPSNRDHPPEALLWSEQCLDRRFVIGPTRLI